MRTETQVILQLLEFAKNNDQIRAVTMNGSRVNPSAPQDLFCDYDVVYFVTDPRLFLNDQSWIPFFGELVILQQNDWVEDGVESYIFLMLYIDGVRIDLAFNHLSKSSKIINDSLTVILLDKDGCLPSIPPSSDCGYYTQKPSRKEFDEAINEIFCCSNNVAKGIWRGDLPYTKLIYDQYIRECLLKLLAWYAAMLHGWQINTGYLGKWLKRFLPAEVWDSLVRTYAGPGDQETWESIFETCRLARQVGLELASHLGYDYPLENDRRMVAYLQKVRALPADAVDFP